VKAIADLINYAGTWITGESLQHMLRDQGIFLLCDRCYFRDAVISI
jgi:hypothetical protein